jgi:hypothetical protein
MIKIVFMYLMLAIFESLPERQKANQDFCNNMALPGLEKEEQPAIRENTGKHCISSINN